MQQRDIIVDTRRLSLSFEQLIDLYCTEIFRRLKTIHKCVETPRSSLYKSFLDIGCIEYVDKCRPFTNSFLCKLHNKSQGVEAIFKSYFGII